MIETAPVPINKSSIALKSSSFPPFPSVREHANGHWCSQDSWQVPPNQEDSRSMGLMQQATHPMWDYVRGRLRKQAAFTHSIENSVILDGSRHDCTNLMTYTHLYVLITTYSWDETFENDDNLKKSENELFCGKDSQGTARVSETESCNFIRVPQGCTPISKYITIVN